MVYLKSKQATGQVSVSSGPALVQLLQDKQSLADFQSTTRLIQMHQIRRRNDVNSSGRAGASLQSARAGCIILFAASEFNRFAFDQVQFALARFARRLQIDSTTSTNSTFGSNSLPLRTRPRPNRRQLTKLTCQLKCKSSTGREIRGWSRKFLRVQETRTSEKEKLALNECN